MPSNLRIVMLGTGDFALPTFERLCDSGHQVVALICQPDRPQGRKQELIPSRIKLAAIARGVPVHQPDRINAPEGVSLVQTLAPDLLVTAAYGQILSAEVLGIPRLGGINLHGSVLPAYRGAAPVARAIQDGRVESGITVIAMSPRVDAGGMIATLTTPIGPEETAGELEDRLANLGAPIVIEAIGAIVAGKARVIPQDPAQVSKAPKLRKEDGIIDWSRTAQQIHDQIRAMQPWPMASTSWQREDVGKEPLRLILHESRVVAGSGEPGRAIETGDRLVIATGSGALELASIQIPGKKAGGIADFMRGYRVNVGDRFGH